MNDKIEGPFGIWPFPIINAIIQIVKIRNEQDFPPVEVEKNEKGEIIGVNVKDE